MTNYREDQMLDYIFEMSNRAEQRAEFNKSLAELLGLAAVCVEQIEALALYGDADPRAVRIEIARVAGDLLDRLGGRKVVTDPES